MMADDTANGRPDSAGDSPNDTKYALKRTPFREWDEISDDDVRKRHYSSIPEALNSYKKSNFHVLFMLRNNASCSPRTPIMTPKDFALPQTPLPITKEHKLAMRMNFRPHI